MIELKNERIVKNMLKFLKISGIVLGALLLSLVLIAWIAHEKEPIGKVCQEADVLANQMMAAVDKPAWDSTKWLQWSFFGSHHYIWDKERDFVQISWKNKRVLLHTKTLTGIAYENGNQVNGKKADKLIQKAWTFFANDSFWLNPVVKAFDPGTERSLVTLKDGREGVKVQYSSGGVTPGDSYVWILGPDKKPTDWKMWVKVLPVGGIGTTWEGWTRLSTGALVATTHGGLGRKINMIRNPKGVQDMAALGLKTDPFHILVDK